MAKQNKNPEAGKVPVHVKPGLVVFANPNTPKEEVIKKYLAPRPVFSGRFTDPNL